MCPIEKRSKLGPVATVIYGAILCVHYPLNFTFMAIKKTKNIIVSSVLLPLRALDYAGHVASSLKKSIKQTSKDLITLILGITIFEITFLKKIVLIGNTKVRGILNYMMHTLNPVKNDQLNHHNESNANNCNQNSSVKKKNIANQLIQFGQSTFHKIVCTILNPFQYFGKLILSFIRKPRKELSKSNNHNTNNLESKSVESDKEKILLKEEIVKLNENLEESYASNDRIKLIKQIRDLKEQLHHADRNLVQQKRNHQTEVKKEREEHAKEIKRLTAELKQAQNNYEQCSKQQTIKFNRERSQFHEELEKLLQRTAQLRKELEKYEIPNNDIKAVDTANNVQEPYIVETIEKIESIKKFTKGLKRKVADFVGTKTDKEFLFLNEQIIKNIINLDSIESKGYNILKKKRLEVLTTNKKLQEELKNKT